MLEPLVLLHHLELKRALLLMVAAKRDVNPSNFYFQGWKTLCLFR
jgi:hypothetical protein